MDWVLNLRGISPTWKLVLCVLGDHADQKGVVWRGMDDVSEEACLSRRAVAAALSKMEHAGLIESKSSKGLDGRQLPNTYSLALPKKEADPSAPGAPGEDADRVHHVHADRVHVVHADRVHLTTSPSAPGASGEGDSLLISKELRSKSFLLVRDQNKDLETAQFIWAKVVAVYPKHKPPKLETWARHIRLMREQDGRTYPEIGELFEWANKDTFWQQNIRSPEKLRAKWDDLWIRMTKANGIAKAQPAAAPGDGQLCCFPDAPCTKLWSMRLGNRGDEPGYCTEHGEIMRDRQSQARAN